MGEEIWVRGFGWGFCRQGKEVGGEKAEKQRAGRKQTQTSSSQSKAPTLRNHDTR